MYKDRNILHVPTEMKKWADRMYDAEFEDEIGRYHECKTMYLHYKELNDRGIEYEPTF
tara:strand:+ start:95 stop:268 length:174 start_codon:yes stop_codon:yes gene_type:complete